MKWVLAALLLAAVVHAEQESVLLILEGDVEKIKITHSQRSKHETDVAWCGNVWGARKGIDVGSQHHYNMQYTVNGETCVVGLFGDDEKHPGSRSEWVEDTNPWYLPSFLSKESARMTPKGHFIKHTPLYTLHIHTEATGLLLTALNGTVITPLHLPTRKASPTEVIPGVEGGIFTTIQSIGDPKDTQNLVFLSAGYLAGEDATFNADVEAAINYLQFDAAQFPLARYFPAMNTFSIFEPSVDKGASKPANGVTVNNNLGCTYGTGSSTEPARILQCSRPRTISLADTGPASAGLVNTVVIVLVNDNDYGGSGLYSTTLRMATLYSKPLKATDPVGRSLLFHELGHAMTDLSDEYTVAATESGRNCAPPFNNKYDTSLPLCEKNCAASTKDLGWQGWIDKGEVPATPGQGCYFSNFFKPGKLDGTPCIMEKVEGKTLCPVCREASALQLYSNGLNLTRPTCPHAEKTVTFLSLEVGSENATFFVNDKLFHVLSNRDEREYDLTWMLDDQVIPVASGSYVILSAIQNSLSVGRHTLSISVVDKTSFILPQHRPVIMDNATSVWQIEVVNSLNDITTELGDSARFTCPSSGPFRATLTPTQYRYYARCTSPDGNCNFNYTTKAYENPTDLDETVKAIENWIFGLGGALVGAGLCIFIFLYFILIIMSDEPKKCMEDTMSKPIKYADHAHHHNHRYIGRILVSSNIVFVLGAIGLCVFLAVLYQKVGAVAKLGLIAGMAMAGGLFLIGSVGWTSAYSKKYVPHNTTNPNRVVPLIFSSCLLLLIILAIMVVVVLLYYVGYNSDDNGSSVQSYLEDQWTDAVSSDPGLVCTAQKQFKCSGWNVACDRVFSPKNCPSDCELTNALYSQTCKVEVITFLHKWLPIVSSCLLFLVYLLLCGIILSILLVYILRKSTQLEQHKSELLRDGPIEGLLSIARLHHGDKAQFRRNLEAEFKKFDKSGTGRLDKLEFSMLFKSTIGVTLSQEQLDLLFALIDVTGTGLISVGDWIEVLTKTTTLSRDEVIDFLSERKERAALIEDKRRMERIGLIDEDPTCPLELDETNDLSYDQAFQVYGRIDNESFYGMRNEFMKLIKIDEAGQAYITVDDYREHLKETFKLNTKSRAAKVVIEGLPPLIDKEDQGQLSWTDWVATYFIRRDCYMEILTLKSGLRKKKAADIKRAAEATGMSFFVNKGNHKSNPDAGQTEHPNVPFLETFNNQNDGSPAGREADSYGMA